MLKFTIQAAFFYLALVRNFEVRAAPSEGCFSPIVWNACPGAASVQCASYKVPLDYSHPQVGTATLALARVPATREPKLGTLFINPGGPGGGGVDFAQRMASSVTVYTNGQYDVVGWDPRGVNQTTPKFTCGFSTLAEADAFINGSFFDVGFEARGNFTDPGDLQRFFASVPAADKFSTSIGQKCAAADGSFLKYTGTTSVVQDILALTDCLDGPGKPVNFYGFSYGTVIGDYLVNLYPERVGHVIIDGVVDSIVWATAPSYEFFDRSLQDVEAVFAGFARLCAAAGPTACAFSQEGSTEASLIQDLRDLIDTAYDLHKQGKTNVTSYEVRDFTYSHLPSPSTWPTQLAPQLAAWRESFSTGSPAGLVSAMSKGLLLDNVDPGVEALVADTAVRCVDSIDQNNVTTLRVFEEIVKVAQNESRLFGIIMLSEYGGIFCHKFPIRGVGRFHGPFDRKLANPILVVANTGDPRTPIENAQKIAAALGDNARLLVQDGFGHTSTAQSSNCTHSTIQAYLVNNTLPPVGHVCPTDFPIFS